MTIDDPKVFKRPFSVSMSKILATDTEIPETICENEKDTGHLVGGGVRLGAETLSTYAGTYEFGAARQANVTLFDGFLFLQDGPNGLKRVMVP